MPECVKGQEMSKERLNIEELFNEIDRRLCGISGSLMGGKAALNHGGKLSWKTLVAIKQDADAIAKVAQKLRQTINHIVKE